MKTQGAPLPGKRSNIKVVHYGLGSVGIEAVKLALEKNGLEVVGAVDINRGKVGKDLGEVTGSDHKLGIKVSPDLKQLLSKVKPHIIVHTTSSSLKKIYPQVEEIISSGMNLVSSTEELFFPWAQNEKLARQIDSLAKKKEVTVLGVGVNPGFVMDSLVVFLTAASRKVKKIRVERVVNASTRRLPLQRKIGAGMIPEEFRAKVDEGKLGHVGLKESLFFVAHNLGWNLDGTEESIEPMIAEKDVTTQYLRVEAGQVSGIKHIARGMKNGSEVIALDLRMYVGAKDPHDLISIEGIPNLKVEFKGGVAGDIATVATLVNHIQPVVEARAGLVTAKDLPMVSIAL